MRLLLSAMLIMVAGCAFDDEFVDMSSHGYPYAQPYPSCATPPSASGFAPVSQSQPANMPLPAQSPEPPR